jgi:hypothetical protein
VRTANGSSEANLLLQTCLQRLSSGRDEPSAHCKATYSSKLVLKDVVAGQQNVAAKRGRILATELKVIALKIYT